MDLLNAVLDMIFSQTVRRNFVRCPVDPNFYIYSDNQHDDNSRLQNKQKTNYRDMSASASLTEEEK